MLICPMCKKALAEWTSECPRCRTDVSILVDYVSHLRDGLVRADRLTREGDLAEAVWAYLEVLEVDPDNVIARGQVNRVAAAVRQFDRVAIGRRWLDRLRRQARFRRWLSAWQNQSEGASWWNSVVVGLLVLAVFLFGYWMGQRDVPEKTGPNTPAGEVQPISP
jgi:hypothetical protein